MLKKILIGAKSFSDFIDRLTRIAVIPVALVFIAIIFFGVWTRFILKKPIVISEEISRISFLWTCFLGACICVKQENHIRFEFILKILRGRLLSFFSLLFDLINGGFFLFLFFHGMTLLNHVIPTTFPASGMSQAWMYAALPVSSLCMVIHVFFFLLRDMTKLFDGIDNEGGSL